MTECGPSSAIEHTSPYPFQETVQRIVAGIQAAGLTIFAQIDHAAGARDVGLSMLPTLVLIYGSPAGGTPVMLARPQAALDLPLRVMIREEAGGRAVIAFHPVTDMLRRIGVPSNLAARLEPAQALLVQTVSR